MYKTIGALVSEIKQKGFVIFTSKKIQLRHRDVIRHGIAGGDFNPAHCVPGREHLSMFRGVISQGIAIVSRAEGVFLQLLTFTNPLEIVARGIDSLVYHSPLYVGDTYYYKYRLTRPGLTGPKCRVECDVVCFAVEHDGEERLIASWSWHVLFVEVPFDLSRRDIARFKIKSYARSVLEQCVLRPLGWGVKRGSATALVVAFLGLACVGVQGHATRQLQHQTESCSSSQRTCPFIADIPYL